MTDDELNAATGSPLWVRVRVQATDYAYEGWLVSVFRKRSDATRCVVEDDNGRLFIHNAGQIERA